MIASRNVEKKKIEDHSFFQIFKFIFFSKCLLSITFLENSLIFQIFLFKVPGKENL